MRKFFMVVIASVFAWLAVPHTVQAGVRYSCVSAACAILHRGHVRGRIPVACVHIPYVKERYGYVALFVLRDFHPQYANTPERFREQLRHAAFVDSKVTGRVDDFCRNKRFLLRGSWIVLCDEHHWGAITGEALRYTIRTGWPPHHDAVVIGNLP